MKEVPFDIKVPLAVVQFRADEVAREAMQKKPPWSLKTLQSFFELYSEMGSGELEPMHPGTKPVDYRAAAKGISDLALLLYGKRFTDK